MNVQFSSILGSSFSRIEQRNDDTLVADAKCGDESALVELWRRHSNAARSKLWRITGNWDDTEDILQDTYIKSYVHLHQFDGRSKFSTWLTRIAINTALMLLRKRRRRPEILVENYEEDARPSGTAGKVQDIESEYIRSERSARLKFAVSNLQPSLRSVIELKHERDLTVEEIAQMTGLSVSAIKSRLLRARLVLRESMATPAPKRLIMQRPAPARMASEQAPN